MVSLPQTPQPPQSYTSADSNPLAPPPDPIASLAAALRGHYEFERELGQGAFATVYLARDLKHERKVAIKVLRADPNSELGEMRFVREIRMLARLQHPNILPLHDSGHVENLLYYVMPYVSGETLRDRLRAERQLPWETACNIARDVADALAYAHGQGIIHRDIKPENILLSAGHPMLSDFGIARAIDVAGVKQLTRTGMGSPGTPAYMSPEQLLGVSEIDARSDIYSLGCVLYEMLTGVAPFADDETFVKRFTDPVPSAVDLRPELPKWVDSALRPALERDAESRYATAAEFASALQSETVTGARTPHSLPRAPTAGRRRLTQKRIAIASLALVAIVLAGIGASLQSGRLQRLIGASPIDSSRFVVLVPRSESHFADSVGQATGERVYESLRSWTGLNVASDQEVADVVRERGRSPATLREGMQVAAAVRAGRMLWGRATGGDANKIRLELFDVRNNTNTGRYAIIDARADSAQLSRALISVLTTTDRPARATDGDGLTNSFAAWTDYNAGHEALAAWDLKTAEQKFAAARLEDPAFPLPHLWLAQIGSWLAPDKPNEWGESARRAAGAANVLNGKSKLMAAALMSLAAGSYPTACERYAQITQADSTSFVGWYGLGECQALDSLVIPSTKSPSTWAFRTSTPRAAEAYMRALSIEPGAHIIFPFERLTNLLPVAASRPRVGHNAGPNPTFFAALPSIDRTADTLAFVPYPRSQFAALPTSAMASSNRALERNTERLAEFAATWTQQRPAEPAAFEALADMLDASGEIFAARGSRMSALEAITQARRLAAREDQQLRTAVKEVWIRFKRGEFATARTLADSILAAKKPLSEADARNLLGLAALTGNVTRTADLARDYRWYVTPSRSIPPAVAAPAARLFAFALFGSCDLSDWQTLRRDLNSAIDSYVEAREAEAIRADLLNRPLILMSPCTAGQSALEIRDNRSRLVLMQQAFGRRDTRTLRALLDTVAEVSKMQRPGDVSPDYIYQQAWLRAAIGDTARAERLLDRTLNGLSGVSTATLQEPAAAAGIIRAMRLRVNLANATGDSQNETKWANAANAMWAAGAPRR